ncbi:glutathione S-transferase family protein [Belnapia sp. T6]|uniref:glutathione transferase n=1 Tax=Belnapia mucosa TaxID=2804532 RepID=A0ABS1UYK6_9PROT|nr:glutathione S-transferase family protein [Belnapia mucosa]MBL6454543.1 glutathione S-transferase family protein [Belnapia mucosa]
MTVLLYGPAYSTYTRTARLALEEKGVAYDLREVDTLAGEGQKAEHLARHPWGKVPVLEHDGFSLYETVAIARYADEAFPGPALQPTDAKHRARMAQVCAVLDHYGWSPMVITVFVQRVVVPMRGGVPDQGAIDGALPQAERVLAAVESLTDGGEFLIGSALSLADLHLAPILDYFVRTEDGRAALSHHPRLSTWWKRIEQRPSVAKTRPSFG